MWHCSAVRRSALLGLLLVTLSVGCDLQPPKHDVPTAPGPAAPPGPTPGAVIADAGTAPPAPTPGGGAAPAGEPAPGKPTVEPTQACTDVGVHIAEVVIGSITDPAQKAALEQDRTKLVRRAAETCTIAKWNAAAQQCFLAAKDAPALETCGKSLAAPAE